MSRSVEPDDDRPPLGEMADRQESSPKDNSRSPELTETFYAVQRGLRNFLRSRLPQQADVDDCLQRIFLAAFNQQRTLPPGAHRAWLYRVAANESARWWREQSAGERAIRKLGADTHTNAPHHCDAWTGEPTCEDLDPSELIQSKETLEQIQTAMTELPADTQQILRMRLHDGMTFQTIAEQLQLPLGTVLTRTRRALDKIRREIDSD